MHQRLRLDPDRRAAITQLWPVWIMLHDLAYLGAAEFLRILLD